MSVVVFISVVVSMVSLLSLVALAWFLYIRLSYDVSYAIDQVRVLSVGVLE